MKYLKIINYWFLFHLQQLYLNLNCAGTKSPNSVNSSTNLEPSINKMVGISSINSEAEIDKKSKESKGLSSF